MTNIYYNVETLDRKYLALVDKKYLPMGDKCFEEKIYDPKAPRETWDKIVEISSRVANGKECVGCVYNATCPKCPSMRLKDLTSGHCNPDMCELTKRLVSHGVKKIKEKEENC